MFEDFIGLSGQSASVYLPNDTRFDDLFLAFAGGVTYPVPDTRTTITDVNKEWSFAFSVGNDVPDDAAIDRVGFGFLALVGRQHTVRGYFKTGGVRYYLDTQEGLTFPPDYTQYGNFSGLGTSVSDVGGGNNPWLLNPATGLPWTKADITGGEFGIEASDSYDLGAVYVQVFWGYGLTVGSNAGGTPAAAPCGQSATLSGAFTYYDSQILEVSPRYGSIAGGDPIQIRGYNFVAGSTIDIGGLPATDVAFVDEQHFVCTTPAHGAGFADVVINEPSGNTVVLRNGFQYTLLTRGEDIRRTPGINVSLQLNTGANTCTLRVDGDSNPPRVGEKIEIVDTFVSPRRLLFAGNVQSVEQIYEGLKEQLAWNVTAVDFTWLMNRRRPFGTYTQTPVSVIVKDIIQKYAPGFTTRFVQSDLAKVSISFDGSADLQTCLSVLARMIGGGHWYVDFSQDVHFFHIVPPVVNMPTLPTNNLSNPAVVNSVLRVGPATAPQVLQGSLISNTFSFDPGMYEFQVTFVYDNGSESAYGAAKLVALDGRHQVVFSLIPIGADIGSITCIRRRIYYKYTGPNGGAKRRGYVQLNDNVTTGFSSDFAEVNASSSVVISMLGAVPPAEAFVSPPACVPATPPVASSTFTPAVVNQPEYRPSDVSNARTWTPGVYRFKVVNIYQDLTESQPGPESNAVYLSGTTLAHVTVPRGTAINSVFVIGRRIVAKLDGADDSELLSWWIVPDNTTDSADISPETGASQSGAGAGSEGNSLTPNQPPTWPNNDGPFLEDFDTPGEINDSDTYLLRDPQVRSAVDLSQVRNRIFIRGGGSSLTLETAKGVTSLPVTECAYYSSNGGEVFVEGEVLQYTGLSVLTGPGNLLLKNPTPEPFNASAPVALYVMVEDKVSQDDLGRVELDSNGQPTDGVHEFTIIDSSLVTPFQLYMRGYAELEIYARPITTVSYSTRDPKTRPGATVSINLTNPPIKGEFLIQSVTIDQIHDEANELLSPRYNVSTSSSRFDLGDLFYQWSMKTSNPDFGAGGGLGPPPNVSGITEVASDAINSALGSSDVTYFFAGVDQLLDTKSQWVRTEDGFKTVATLKTPPSIPDSTAGASCVTDGPVRSRGFSTGNGSNLQDFYYPGQYTRGSAQPVRHYGLESLVDETGAHASVNDHLKFTIPLNPGAVAAGFSFSGTSGFIRDWSYDAVHDRLYLAVVDALHGPPPHYGRIIEYDNNTGSVRQIGEMCSGAPGGFPHLGDGAVVFASVLYNPVDGYVYCGVGSGITGVNCTASGIYRIDPRGAATTWTQMLNTEIAASAVGETPNCMAAYNGKIYVGMGGFANIGARMLESADGVTWTLSTTAGTSANKNEWTRLKVFKNKLYATSWVGAATRVTRIHQFDGTTWTEVKQIDSTGGGAKYGVAMDVDWAQRGTDAAQTEGRLAVLCLDSAGAAFVLYSTDGNAWQKQSSSDLVNLTSIFGTMQWFAPIG